MPGSMRRAGSSPRTGRRAAQPGHLQRLLRCLLFCGEEGGRLVNLYCWAHVRRHFVRAGDANPVQLKYWTDAWLDRIRDLYAAHDELMAAWQENAAPAARDKQDATARLEKAHEAWDTAITAIDEARKKQMAAPGLQEPAKKALATLDREWDGLTAHRNYPMVSLDNNKAERQIRGPVVTRKNAGGSRNDESARNAAVIWTVTATARMAGLNILTYLTAYLDGCGRNSGKPLTGPALERFLRGTRARKTSAPGHSHRRPDKNPARITPSPTRRPTAATSAVGMPFHRTSEYLPSRTQPKT